MRLRNISPLIIAWIISINYSVAQAPDKISYQSILRDQTGEIIPNRQVSLRVSFLEDSPTGSPVYTELQKPVSNDFGLMNVYLGTGLPLFGSFSAIQWHSHDYYLKLEIDITGGTDYVHIGTVQLVTVPYAFYAKNAGHVNGMPSTIDTDSTNELQTLTLNGNILTISGGNSVTLPPGADNWGTQVVQTTARLTGDGTSANPLDLAQQGATSGQVLKWNGTSWAPAADSNTTYTAGNGISISGTTISAADVSDTNEIQILSLSGHMLSLSSGGGTVDLSPLTADVWRVGGNSVTLTDFLGTTNSQPLRFKANNMKAGHVGLSDDGSTFFGYQAGNSDDGTDNQNTFLGYQSGMNTSTGFFNTSVGYKALFANTEGIANVAIGTNALSSNNTGNQNIAIGINALSSNTTGNNNISIGKNALLSNTIASDNIALGQIALYYNTTGDGNTAIGTSALRSNQTGTGNTAVGFSSGLGMEGFDFNYCTFLGIYTMLDTIRSNVTMLGGGISTAQCTGNNQVILGNTAITQIRAQVGSITTYSDARTKFNVREDVKGLDFILRLRPVSYQQDPQVIHQLGGTPDSLLRKIDHSEIKEKRFVGLIAQEVEQAMKESGYEHFPGIDIPRNKKHVYSLRYGDFIIPMIKAMQEQQQIIEKQQRTIEMLHEKLFKVENTLQLLVK